MLPHVTRTNVTMVTIAMPLPKHIAKDRNDLKDWQECYGYDNVLSSLLRESIVYNAKIKDIYLNFYLKEFYFQLSFSSESATNMFLEAVNKIIIQ